jgi:hypothetical protein
MFHLFADFTSATDFRDSEHKENGARGQNNEYG